MIEINLVPDVKQELLKAERSRNTVISATIIGGIIAIGVVVVLSVSVFVVQNQLSAGLDKSIEEENTKLTAVDGLDEALTLQNQLQTISRLHDEKTVSSRVFSLWDKIAPASITIQDFRLDTELGTISIEGQAKDFSALDSFEKTILLTKLSYSSGEDVISLPLVEGGSINKGAANLGVNAQKQSVVSFELTFTYPPELLSRLSSNLLITPPKDIDVTDSNIALPGQVLNQGELENQEQGGSS